jgi:hypothetical protein
MHGHMNVKYWAILGLKFSESLGNPDYLIPDYPTTNVIIIIIIIIIMYQNQ